MLNHRIFTDMLNNTTELFEFVFWVSRSLKVFS